MIADLFTRGASHGTVEREPAPAHTLPTQQRNLLEVITRYYALTGEPCSASYLARRMRLHHSTIQQHLSVLYRKGWLTTETGPAIPRSINGL